jgi:cell division protein FtsL
MTDEGVMQEKERRYIYNGDAPPPSSSGYAIRQNRRGTRRPVSTFTILLLIFTSGIAIVVYVNNILTVNRIAGEVRQLEQRLQEVRNANERLRAEVSTKSAVDRIAREASSRLGLKYAVEQPVYFPVDEEKLDMVK